MLFRLSLALFFLCATTGFSAEPESAKHLPGKSITEVKEINFLGKQFSLKYFDEKALIPIYEFYTLHDTPQDWLEMTDLRIYPLNPVDKDPVEYAKRVGSNFKNKFPYLQYAIYINKESKVATIDFFYPDSTRKDKKYIEFNFFKFFNAPGSQRVIAFHYAKNIVAPGPERNVKVVSDELNELRVKLLAQIDNIPVVGE